MLDRLYTNWVYGGFLAGLLILALSPLLLRGWSWPMIAVFLQLPVYMLHQYEEHDDGRFGRFVNQRIGGGRMVLPQPVIFLINVPGVWGVNAVSIWLAAKYNVGFGLIGVYLTLVNGIVHIVPSARMRIYNPGLVTGVLFFLPLGIWSLAEISAVPCVGWAYHLLGLGLAILIHAAIMAYVFSNRARVAREMPAR